MKCMLQCTICPSSADSVFSGLSAKQLESLAPIQTTNSYKKQQIVFYEGNPALGVYCISEGKVKIYKSTEDGKQRIFRISSKGELLGYASIFSGEPEQYTAEALEDSKVCFLEKNGFLGFLRKNPDVSLTLLGRLSRETIRSHEQTMDQAFKSVRRRLAEMLLSLKNSFGVENEKGVLLDIALSRDELSQSIGATMETTVRLLSEFKKEGLIADAGHRILILKSGELLKLTASSF